MIHQQCVGPYKGALNIYDALNMDPSCTKRIKLHNTYSPSGDGVDPLNSRVQGCVMMHCIEYGKYSSIDPSKHRSDMWSRVHISSPQCTNKPQVSKMKLEI